MSRAERKRESAARTKARIETDIAQNTASAIAVEARKEASISLTNHEAIGDAKVRPRILHVTETIFNPPSSQVDRKDADAKIAAKYVADIRHIRSLRELEFNVR